MAERGYGEGFDDGKIYQQLHEHSVHLTKINGSTEKVAIRLAAIEVLLQQIVDKADYRAASAKAEQAARDETVKTVATALEKKEEARRDSSASRWTPVNRWMAVLVGIVAVVAPVIIIIMTR
jgi:hypothetical protein